MENTIVNGQGNTEVLKMKKKMKKDKKEKVSFFRPTHDDIVELNMP